MPTFFYDENNISTKHNKTNVRMKQQKQILLINQKSQDLPVLKIPPLRHGKKEEHDKQTGISIRFCLITITSETCTNTSKIQ